MRHIEPSRQIHEMLAGLRRHCSGFHAADLPENGIYFFYESGEVFEGGDRIVRVGTHTGEDRLPKRLRLHYRGSARTSVFRRNVGKALVAAGDSQITPELLTSLEPKTFPVVLEQEISHYFEANFSFSVIPVDKKDDRLRLEAGLIASLGRERWVSASEHWLGRSSPVDAICSSGLWNRNHVGGSPLSDTDFELLQSARWWGGVDV